MDIRKGICFILTIILMLSFMACGSAGSGQATPSPIPVKENSATPPPSIAPATPDPEPTPEPQKTLEENLKIAMDTLEVWDGSIAESFEAGDGSRNDPYLIANAAQLAKLSEDTNSGIDFSSKFFLLTNDILLNDISAWDFGLTLEENIYNCNYTNTWTPIGLNYGFKGNFDGGGKTIYGLFNGDFYHKSYSSSAAGSVGLFGDFSGTISNTTIACGWFGATSGSENIGSLVGYLDKGSISNCHVLSTVIFPWVATNIGGICGNCYDGMISSCTASGIIQYSATNLKIINVGGIVGTASYDAKVHNSYNSTLIKTSFHATEDYSNGFDLPGANVGGICGIGIIIENCHNAGEISIEAFNELPEESEDIPYVRAGGIAGVCHDSIKNCSSRGQIIYTGDITFSDNGAGTYIGGIAGLLGNTRAYGDYAKLEEVVVDFCCSNMEFETGDAEAYIGGVSGSACGEISVTNCYYNSAFSNKAVNITLARKEEYGTDRHGDPYFSLKSKIFTNQIKGLSETELKKPENYSGWDFTSEWTLNERINDGFPIPTSIIDYLEME